MLYKAMLKCMFKAISEEIENGKTMNCIILNYLIFVIKLWMGSTQKKCYTVP